MLCCAHLHNVLSVVCDQVLVAPARGVHPTLSRQLLDALAHYQGSGSATTATATATATAAPPPPHHEPRVGITGFPEPNPPPTPASAPTPATVPPAAGALTRATLSFAHIRDLYPHFQYEDLAGHPAMVILPYQVSFMSLFEFYRMEVRRPAIHSRRPLSLTLVAPWM